MIRYIPSVLGLIRTKEYLYSYVYYTESSFLLNLIVFINTVPLLATASLYIAYSS